MCCEVSDKMPNPVVTVENLGKSYWLYPSMKRRLLGCFIDPRRMGAWPFHALSGLTFELYPGEAIAIIGKNGAGKSTALQILAGITPPTEGSFQINGRVCALLELGSGFNPEFTGRQNIVLAGALLGLSREQIRQEEENIVTFADIGEFIDQPVKFYSSGMFVRLAFAVAVAGQPDLLIVDEALAVGDIFFRQKCYARLREMREKGMSVILVTHSMGDVYEFCGQAVLLDRGHVIYFGDTQEATLRYYALQQTQMFPVEETSLFTGTEPQDDLNGNKKHPWPYLQNYFLEVSETQMAQYVIGASVLRYFLTDECDRPTSVFIQGSCMRLYSECIVENKIDIPTIGVAIWNDKGQPLYAKNTAQHNITRYDVLLPPLKIFSLHEITLNIACGEYTISLILSSTTHELYENRHIADYNDWEKKSLRLAAVTKLVSIVVVLPETNYPSRVANFGMIDMPSRCELYINN